MTKGELLVTLQILLVALEMLQIAYNNYRIDLLRENTRITKSIKEDVLNTGEVVKKNRVLLSKISEQASLQDENFPS